MEKKPSFSIKGEYHLKIKPALLLFPI